MQSPLESKWKQITRIEQLPLLFSLVLISVIVGLMSDVFFTLPNWMNIFRAASLIAIPAIGMVVLILLGQIDLSIGSVYALAGVLSVTALNATESFTVGLLVAIGIGAVVGLINSIVVVYGKVNSLIATLGMMAIVRGAVLVFTNAGSVRANVPGFINFGTGFWGFLPRPLVIAFALFVIVAFLLSRSAIGRHIYSIGGNLRAAQIAGLPTKSTTIGAFIFISALAGLSGFIAASRMNSGQPNAGIGLEFQVISAVILGGVSLSGGKGTISGAMIGVLILGVLTNGLILLNVSSFWQDIVRGFVIIFAVFIDELRRRNLSDRAYRDAARQLSAKKE